MKPSKLSFVLLLLLTTFTTISVAAVDYGICDWLGGYYITRDSCVAGLQSDPNSRTADYHTLAVISANLTISNATAVQSKLDSVSKTVSESTTKALLQSCMDQFSANMTSLRSAPMEAASKNYKGAADVMFKFAAMPGECDDRFMAKKGVSSPLMKENLALINLALLAHAINDYCSNYY